MGVKDHGRGDAQTLAVQDFAAYDASAFLPGIPQMPLHDLQLPREDEPAQIRLSLSVRFPPKRMHQLEEGFAEPLIDGGIDEDPLNADAYLPFLQYGLLVRGQG